MILKKDLLMGIDHNTEQLLWQGNLIMELQERLERVEKEVGIKLACKEKKCPGKIARSANAKAQPRDKSGKFAKKG